MREKNANYVIFLREEKNYIYYVYIKGLFPPYRSGRGKLSCESSRTTTPSPAVPDKKVFFKIKI